MNNKPLLLIFLSLLTVTACGQQGDSIKAKKISIGLAGSPNYSYRFLISNGSAIANQITSDRNNTEIGQIRYNLGASCVYSISNKISLQVGLIFADMGYTTKSQQLIFGDMINATRGFIESPGGALVSSYHYYFASLPITVGYTKQLNKFFIKTDAGIALCTSINSTTRFKVHYIDSVTTTYSQSNDPVLQRINLSFNIGVGLGYTLSKKLSVIAEPTYIQYLLPIVSSSLIDELPFSLGMNFEVYYKF